MTALLLLPMIVISGGAIDLVAHERLRATLQDALDRGVLAAAALSQTQPARATIESYLKSVVSPGTYKLDVELDPDKNSINARHVEATIRATVPTTILRMIRIRELPAVAHSVAEERRSNIEISLLLDISNSMRWDERDNHFPGLTGDSRINAMRPAAKGFIDTVLRDSASDYTTVSLVPFAGQVSVGPVIFDALAGGRRKHNRSSCFELDEDDFKIGMPNFAYRDQTQQFVGYGHPDTLSANERKIVEPWWCPDDPHAARSSAAEDYVAGEGDDTDSTAITVLSNNAARLKQQIDQYQLYGGTGTPYAMKWGLLLLDPVLQPLLQQAMRYEPLKSELGIDPRFGSRPARFEDSETLKFIVLMTDGDVSDQLRPKNKIAPIQYYNNSSRNYKLYNTNQSKKFDDQLCSDAKANGVIIFTIGFYVDGDGAKQMKKCSSGPEYYYQVNSANIDEAFQSIATAIQKIKLLS